ncbi:MAG: AtpZ/AtpI family protein [Weeksellaceae bacterium]|nr:AtpZ/AtpI family protein [Weeksellaceae bacterium]
MSEEPRPPEFRKKEGKDFPESSFRQYAAYSSVVIQMMAVIALGFWGGKQLNDYLELKNNLITVGIGLTALGLALYNTIRNLERINNRN